MALIDINLQEGEGQDFIIERPVGTLEAPADILIEAGGESYPVAEIPQVAGGGDNIFIIND